VQKMARTIIRAKATARVNAPLFKVTQGSKVTLWAFVAPVLVTQIPTGKVIWLNNGGGAWGTLPNGVRVSAVQATLNSSGVAVWSGLLPIGFFQVSVNYTGDKNFNSTVSPNPKKQIQVVKLDSLPGATAPPTPTPTPKKKKLTTKPPTPTPTPTKKVTTTTKRPG